MRNETVKHNVLRAVISAWIITIALAVTAVLTVLISPRRTAADAESGGTVMIHVYDPTAEYSSIAAWVWLKGSSGTGYELGAADSGEQFVKDGNAARPVTVTLTAAQVTALKGGTQLGLLICKSTGETTGEFWSKYEKETEDIFVDLSQSFDADNRADVYYVRKDSVMFTALEDAKMSLEKVTSARFTEKTSEGTVVEFEASSKIAAGVSVKLYKQVLEEGATEPTETEVGTTTASPTVSGFAATAVFPELNDSNFDFSAEYLLEVGKFNGRVAVSKNSFIDDVGFIKTFECKDTQDRKFGAVYDGKTKKTTFSVWAPFASRVSVKLYDNGSKGDPFSTLPMNKSLVGNKWGGVWELTSDDDLNGVYYTYSIVNNGAETETIDPYAKACGINGERGMVVDLAATDPVGWDKDTHLYDNKEHAANANVPIVWELHVKDFSSSADSGMKYKGKYLAFTESGTTVPGRPDLKTGVDYLKDLGVTFVQLNPVYDYGSIDEGSMSEADATKDVFNWGYDPQNYNIPEGSYSTDPSDGAVRINEFKQMVMALHNAGIGVIMDVVYNHTYSTGSQALHKTVPYYYHRTTETGKFSDLSGCGNDTASERTMMRKYMVESVVYWATEYHIDGFRFDLMGIHDKLTIKAIRDALDALDGGKGEQLLMYGEPWTGEFNKNETPYSHTARVEATTADLDGVGKYTSNAGNTLVKYLYQGSAGSISDLPINVAVFNDKGRDGLRGNNDPGQGWANGAANSGNTGKVQNMMEGGCGGVGESLNTGAGSRQVAYASAHDNYTLYDQMIGKAAGKEPPLYYANAMTDEVKRCKLVASAYLMSSGISFMLAGEEMGRTKYGNHNSYNSPTKVNQITWLRQEEFKDLHDYYRTVIGIRKANANIFSYEVAKTSSTGNFTGSDPDIGKIVFTRGNIVVTLEASTLSGSIKVGGEVKASF